MTESLLSCCSASCLSVDTASTQSTVAHLTISSPTARCQSESPRTPPSYGGTCSGTLWSRSPSARTFWLAGFRWTYMTLKINCMRAKDPSGPPSPARYPNSSESISHSCIDEAWSSSSFKGTFSPNTTEIWMKFAAFPSTAGARKGA